MDDESMNLGTCCICEKSDGVRNIVMLDKKAPMPGRGWGCFECGLAPDGASAVLCDPCLEKVNIYEAEIKFACRGYPATDGRIPYEELTEEHQHNESLHNVPASEIRCEACGYYKIGGDGVCPECSERTCPTCGCTDSAGCLDGCYWTPSGICSACEEQLEAEYI